MLLFIYMGYRFRREKHWGILDGGIDRDILIYNLEIEFNLLNQIKKRVNSNSEGLYIEYNDLSRIMDDLKEVIKLAEKEIQKKYPFWIPPSPNNR